MRFGLGNYPLESGTKATVRFVGNWGASVSAILLGVAVWRSGTLPRWAGVLYAPTGLLISVIGLAIRQAQT